MRRDFVDYAIRLPAEQWHALSVSMSWFYRNAGLSQAPAVIRRRLGYTPLKEDWYDLAKDINHERKYRTRIAKRTKEKAESTKRKEYMREYMRRYRQRALDGVEKEADIGV